MTMTSSTAGYRRYIPVLFTLTIFLSASLLFFVQPLFAKIVLPHIGGAPAVWTTAMLFFQTALIAGYLYAHLLTKYASVRVQVVTHMVLWIAAIFFLPLAIPNGWVYDADYPAVTQTLLLFALGVGLPFAALSANAPLIQAWYAKSQGPSADDPYFLYGASNLGSLLALLAFPLVAEPLLGATKIGWGWATGFVVLGLLLFVSGISISGKLQAESTKPEATSQPSPTGKTLIYWAFIAFIPSSLMLAVTTKISTEIGALPLIWVIPLSLFLLTFVLTFRKRPLISTRNLRIMFLIAALPLALILPGIVDPLFSWSSVAILIAGFFVIALFVHQKLYESRPSGSHLTLFYLTMSVGGALGGVFNSIVAPIIFDRLNEGIVTIGLAVLLILGENTSLRAGTLFKGFAVGAAAIGLVFAGLTFTGTFTYQTMGVGLGIAGLIALLALRQNTVSTFVGVATVFGIGGFLLPDNELYMDRSFFGLHHVADSSEMSRKITGSDAGVRIYSNGSTIHGAQSLLDLNAARPRAMTYYGKGGPIHQAISSERGKTAKTIGIVGLGVGVMACYKLPGQSWHFYEIDKHVDQIARDPRLFTFMSSCAGDSPTHLGDARMVLEHQDIKFDVLMIDAFSSDSIPLHLSTIEAIQIYLDRLNPDGMLVFHVSNRFYKVDLPITRAADELGLVSKVQFYDQDIAAGKLALDSTVVIVGRTRQALGELANDPRWEDAINDGGRAWTDDYANPLSILR